MDTRDALDLARALLARHGLTSWSVEWDCAKTRSGICRFEEQTIGLSAPLTRLHDEAEVRDTILYEIAHALAGPRAKHGPRWRQVAHSIGCTGSRCTSAEAERIAGAWLGVCPAGHGITRHRAPTRVMTCPQCSPHFDLTHLFGWSLHGDPARMHANYAAELKALRSGTTPVTMLPVGSTVRITTPGRYAGQLGTIVRRGRTRFHVRCVEFTIDLPFAGVEGVGVDLLTELIDEESSRAHDLSVNASLSPRRTSVPFTEVSTSVPHPGQADLVPPLNQAKLAQRTGVTVDLNDALARYLRD